MLSRVVSNSLYAAMVTAAAFGVISYLVYLMATFGEGIFSGIFVSILLLIFIAPSLFLAGILNVLFKRKRRLIAGGLSVLISLACAYAIYREFAPPAGVTEDSGVTIIRHTGADGSGVIESLLFFAIVTGVVVTVFFWLESKFYDKRGKRA